MPEMPAAPNNKTDLPDKEHRPAENDKSTKGIASEVEPKNGTEASPATSEEDKKKWIKSPLSDLAQILMAVATFALVIVSTCQTTKISDQTEAIIKQTTATQRQADAADSQLTVSRTALRDQRITDSNQLNRFDSQLSLSRDAAKGQREDARIQLDSFHAQLSISREVMQRQLRAYVYVEAVRSADDSYSRYFAIKNSGQTPAYGLSFWSITEDKMLSPHLTFGDRPHGDSSNLTLNPGNIQGFLSGYFTKGKTDSLIKTGEVGVFTYGEITYRDAFGIERFTKFRYRYGHLGNPYVVTVCAEGNESN